MSDENDLIAIRKWAVDEPRGTIHGRCARDTRKLLDLLDAARAELAQLKKALKAIEKSPGR